MKKFEIRKFALASLLASVAAVIIIIGGFFEILDLTVSAIASFAVVIAVIELKGKYPYFVYLTAAILSMILMPMRSASIYFLCFLGFYPILKAALVKLNRILAWVVKFSAFNTCCIATFFIFKSVLGVADISEKWIVVMLLASNVFFVAYDYALSGIIALYIVKLRKILKLKNLF